MDSLPDLHNMTLLNRFLVTGRLPDRGTEAVLYRAVDKDGGTYAVKLYRRTNAVKPEVVSKLRTFRHPAVAELAEFGEISGHQFSVVSFYDGVTFADLIRQGVTVDPVTMRKVFLPALASGLAALHEIGILHKDIKPDNILFSEQDRSVRLLDFGISTYAETDALVITQTGRTPVYAAPETMAGLFSRDSDYYSLGITVFEMMTGRLPYGCESKSAEALNRLSLLQKIIYPDNFPQDFRDLVDGLTFHDISSRNVQDSSRRRWGAEELAAWLRGETVTVPGRSGGVSRTGQEKKVPFLYKGGRYYRVEDVIAALLADWNGGRAEVMRGKLARWYELNDCGNEFRLCEKAAASLESAGSTETDEVYFRLMYNLAPSGNTLGLFWKSLYFAGLRDFGQALLREGWRAVNGEKDTDELLLDSVPELTGKGLLEHYVRRCPNGSESEYLRILELHRKISETSHIDRTWNALRLGYALTGEDGFSAAGHDWESATAFDRCMSELAERDPAVYSDLAEQLRKALEGPLGKVLPKTALEAVQKHLKAASRQIRLLRGRFIFRDPSDLLQHLADLQSAGSSGLTEFYGLMYHLDSLYGEQSSSWTKHEKDSFLKFRADYRRMLCISGVIYSSIQAVEQYVQELAVAGNGMAETFLRTRESELQKLMKRKFQRAEDQECVNRLLANLSQEGIGATINSEDDTAIALDVDAIPGWNSVWFRW